MKHPFFSIVIPTYNQSNYLKTALTSIFKQKFKNYEVIVVDNHSKDETYKVVKNFKKKIIYKKIRNNGVIAKSRNLGIKLSKGKWIAFLDSDDSWYQDRLQKLYDFIKNSNDCPIICTNELIVNKINGKKKIWKFGPFRKNFYENLIKYGSCISTSGSIIKKEILKQNKILFSEEKDFPPYEDYDFWMRLAQRNIKFKFLNSVLGEHLFHTESWGAKNKLLCKKSNLSILKHHVFKIQNFTEKKNNLWSHVNCRLIIEDIIELLLKKNYYQSFLLLFKLFFRYPIKSIVHIFVKIKKIFLT